MRTFLPYLRRRLRLVATTKRGQTLVEYALILAVMSVIAIGVFAEISNSVELIFIRIAGILDTAQSSH